MLPSAFRQRRRGQATDKFARARWYRVSAGGRSSFMREGESSEAGGTRVGAGEMRKRRTTLEDGRYLIYYTFEDSGGADETEGDAARGPHDERRAEDGRGV